jgi:tetratricopeptide (TPR) repeat protein
VRYLLILSLFISLCSLAAHGQSPTSAAEYSQRGIARFQTNDLDGAIADFTKVIELNGESLEFCYYFRGLAHYRKGNSEQAIADLGKAISIKADPRFYDDRGNLLARQGELDRAMADLNKAIELSAQYARAYGDRGLVHLMRGEEKDAELDFKKCFALDASLETQFRTAADKIKQRQVSDHEPEKPSDVQILKFSWAETPSKVLIAESAAVPVNAAPVSATGTRVLGDPNAKNPAGPAEIMDPSGTSLPPSKSRANTRDIIDYKFTASVKNTGSKTIVSVKWVYYFNPKDLAHERLAYLFNTKMEIKPGKEKTLNDVVTPNAQIKLPSKFNHGLYTERIAILRLDYADGSSWGGAPATVNPQQPRPPK